MIPKRMYFFWSSNIISWMRYMTLYSFRKMNPSWEIVLCLSQNNTCTTKWPGEHDFTSYKGINYFHKIKKLNIIIESVKFPDTFNAIIKSPVHESDLYRYYKLYNDGGFYSDTDVLYFRSMDNIYNEISECNANIVLYTQRDYTAIGFLAAEKDNAFYRDLMLSALDTTDVDACQAYGTDLFYNFCGQHDVNDVIKSRYSEAIVFVIPMYLVYHLNSWDIERAFSSSIGVEGFDIKSIGYHWYGGSPIAQKFNNIMTEDNYINYKTTFSAIVKEILK